MNDKKFFNYPVQVAFWDYNADMESSDEEHWLTGIAYKDEVICGCCDGIFPIDEIYQFAPKRISNPLRPYKSWVTLVDEIKGISPP